MSDVKIVKCSSCGTAYKLPPSAKEAKYSCRKCGGLVVIRHGSSGVFEMPSDLRFKPIKRTSEIIPPKKEASVPSGQQPPPRSPCQHGTDTQPIGAGGDFEALNETAILQRFEERDQTIRVRRDKTSATSGPLPKIHGYKVLSELGRGSFGVVYRALQLSMDRLVAIKVLYPECAAKPEISSRFVSEARAVGRLNHPNIVQGYDAGEDAGTYYFSMEYLDGHKVSDIIQRGGALDASRASRIVLDITRALEHAHKHGIIHRDIKPGNIVLSKSGGAKLCDLGLAFSAGDAESNRSGALGTPSYISPEQARGEKEIDTRSDIYSLGAAYYHMLTGSPPFLATTAAEVIRKHIVEIPVPPRQRNPLVPPDAERIVLKMLAKRKEDRYQDPASLRADLDALVQSLAASPQGQPKPATRAEKPRVPPSRRRYHRRLR
ncbi:MAG: protein kinase [Planctomycetota bacterium]|nr:protein kinase [Planctomycetota bacterium]